MTDLCNTLDDRDINKLLYCYNNEDFIRRCWVMEQYGELHDERLIKKYDSLTLQWYKNLDMNNNYHSEVRNTIKESLKITGDYYHNGDLKLDLILENISIVKTIYFLYLKYDFDSTIITTDNFSILLKKKLYFI